MTDRCSSSIRRGHIASSKHRRHPDHPQVVVDLQASQPITGYRQLLGQAAGPHAGAPHHGGRCQPFPDDSVTPPGLTAATLTPVLVSTPLSNSACSITGRADKPISEPTKGLWSMSTTRG